MDDVQVFYPKDNEFPNIDTAVLAFWDGDDFALAKVTPDGEGEPLWFRMDGKDWVLCDPPTCYRLQDEQ